MSDNTDKKDGMSVGKSAGRADVTVAAAATATVTATATATAAADFRRAADAYVEVSAMCRKAEAALKQATGQAPSATALATVAILRDKGLIQNPFMEDCPERLISAMAAAVILEPAVKADPAFTQGLEKSFGLQTALLVDEMRRAQQGLEEWPQLAAHSTPVRLVTLASALAPYEGEGKVAPDRQAQKDLAEMLRWLAPTGTALDAYFLKRLEQFEAGNASAPSAVAPPPSATGGSKTPTP